MTDTHTDNGVHDVHDDHGSTFDTSAQHDELDDIARAAKAKRARHMARIDQLNADRDRITDAIKAERAQVEKCDAILGWQAKDVQPRGKRRSAQPTTKGRK